MTNQIKTFMRKQPYFPLLLLILAQIIVILFWGFHKEGLNVDELWSFGLANSFFHPSVFWNNAMEGTYLSSSYFRRYLEVDSGQVFRFDSVYFNLANDAHPPLYFFILHAVCSLFPDTFNMWYGIIPNILFFIIGQVYLFRLSRKVFINDKLAFLPCLFWGFSAAAISFTLLIRMYMMAIMWTLIIINYLYDFLYDKKKNLLSSLKIVMACLFGFMTHYYLFILCFFLALSAGVYLLIKKRFKDSFIFAAIMALSVLIIFIIFPASYRNLFGNTYSTSAQTSLTFSKAFSHITEISQGVIRDLFFNSHKFTLLCTILTLFLIVILVSNKKIHNIIKTILNTSFLSLILVGSSLFYLVSCIVSPWQATRYVCFIYPVIVFIETCLLCILYFVFKNLFLYLSSKDVLRSVIGVSNSFLSNVLYTSVIIFFLSLSAFTYNSSILYLITGSQSNMQSVSSFSDSHTAAVLLSYNYYKITSKSLEVENLDGFTASIPTKEAVDSAIRLLNAHGIDRVVLYSDAPEAVSEFLPVFARGLGLDKIGPLHGYTLVDDDTGLVAYEVSNEK